ncbi:hypothetical protein HZS_3148 [Henneguya salminicola]|nr:hypothetical protein HZS_3148 [Henneguya salminicola]
MNDLNNTVLNEDSDKKICWVCLGSESEDIQINQGNNSIWISPCLCSGTCKWVHRECLNAYIDQKWTDGLMANINCPICQAKYDIDFGCPINFLHFVIHVERIVTFFNSSYLAASVCHASAQVLRLYSESFFYLVFSFDKRSMREYIPSSIQYSLIPSFFILYAAVRYSINAQRMALKTIWSVKLLFMKRFDERKKWFKYIDQITHETFVGQLTRLLLYPQISYFLGELIYSYITPPFRFLAAYSTITVVSGLAKLAVNYTLLRGILYKNVQSVNEISG